MTLQAIFREIKARDIFSVEYSGRSALGCAHFIELVERSRAQLHAAGVCSGDAVVYHGDQDLQAIVVFWAAVLNGVVFVPVDANWPSYLLGKACSKVAPALALVEDRLLPAWRGLSCAAGIVPLSVWASEQTNERSSDIRQDGVDAGKLDARQHVASSVPSSAAWAPETPASYLFTSGSTGEPKAVVLSHAALARSARLVVDTFAWQPGERLLNLADPHTMSGLRNAFVAAPLAGMSWVCSPRKERENIFALLDGIANMQPQRMVAAPVLLRQINLLGPRVSAGAFASMKALYCTGTDLNADEMRRFHARFGIPVVNYYGLTETVGLCVSQDVNHWSADDASLGCAVGCEIRLVDDNDNIVAQGEVGELQVRLDHPMSDYLRDAEATAEMFDGAWLRTGDLARCDAEGRVSIVGRSGNFIKTLGTEKIQPQEIEVVLELCPGVAEAAVFGWADPAGGERIAALVVATASDGERPTDVDLARFATERLGAARVPTVFIWVAVIPRSANGKILRQHLRGFA